EAGRSDEAIDIFVAFVVAHVDHVAAILVHKTGGALVLEAAERSAFLGRGCRIERIDLDYIAEAIGLVRLLREIEAILKLAPWIEVAGHAIARLVARFALIRITPAHEAAHERLFPGGPRDPRTPP